MIVISLCRIIKVHKILTYSKDHQHDTKQRMLRNLRILCGLVSDRLPLYIYGPECNGLKIYVVEMTKTSTLAPFTLPLRCYGQCRDSNMNARMLNDF